MTRPLVAHLPNDLVCAHAKRAGIDTYLDNFESLLIALRQREMDPDQLDRYARLLQTAERNAMARIRHSVRRKRAAA